MENTNFKIDNVGKEIEEEAAEEAVLALRLRQIHAELCDVQAQLANSALTEEKKRALLDVQQQRLASQQVWSTELQAVRDEKAHLRQVQQQLLDKEKDLRAERAAQLNELTGSTLHRFTSASDFLSSYTPHRLELLLPPCASSQAMGVKCKGPSAVALWHTFDEECRVLLRALRDGDPCNLAVPSPTSAAVHSEDNLHLELWSNILLPLQQALSRSDGFFEAARAAQGVKKGGWTNKSARPDFVLQSRINQRELLVAIEVKTSAVVCVPQSSSLPAMYAAADSDSNLVECVAQLYSYLGVLPFGVLVTDQQLFCMRRKHGVLLCSPSSPLAAGHVDCPAKRGLARRPSADELQAATDAAAAAARKHAEAMGGGRSAGSLTAVAALYCIAKMSQQWWAQPPPQQQPTGAGAGQQQPTGAGAGQQGNSGDDSGADGDRPRSSFLQPMLAPAVSCGTFEGAQHPAAAAEPKPVLLLPTDAESECNSSQLFPGRSFDPRVPGGMPPSLGNTCRGIVLEGAVGGRAAAVKLVDLWQGPEGKEAVQREVRIYQSLTPLQGAHVPHLLGYGFCDEWQYFLATSLEGPSLDSEEGWALGDEATCAGAFAALDAVHRCGVLHGDIALRNFVLAAAAQPAGAGGSAAGGGGDGAGGGSQTSATGQQPQLQPRVMLLDFGHSQLLAEAAEEWGEEPASLMQRERRALRDLLGWEPPSALPVPLPPVDTMRVRAQRRQQLFGDLVVAATRAAEHSIHSSPPACGRRTRTQRCQGPRRPPAGPALLPPALDAVARDHSQPSRRHRRRRRRCYYPGPAAGASSCGFPGRRGRTCRALSPGMG